METTFVTWSYNPPVKFLMVSEAGSVAHAYMQILDDFARDNRSEINRQLEPWTNKGWRPRYSVDGTIFVRTTKTETDWFRSFTTGGRGGMKSYMIVTSARVEMIRD